MKRATLLALAAAFGGSAMVAVGAAGMLAAPRAAEAKPAKLKPAACAALAKPGLFDQTTVSSAVAVAGDADKGLPAYCEVTAVISPTPGSKIGVVYRLPAAWNGKVLGLGGGGWAGDVKLIAAIEGLQRGYATLQTDAGHDPANLWNSTWSADPDMATDFAFRGVHLMTVVGKQVAVKYYGQAQSKAYFQGCSTGGRQGLMEVQRFPDDYDGVIAAAPVYNLTVQTTAVLRDNILTQPGGRLTTAALSLVNKAVLKACDAKDGLEDGIVADPRACDWDPAEIQCKDGQSGDDCLSKGQAATLQAVYTGVQNFDGRVAAWPLSRGGELGWSVFLPTGEAKTDVSGGGMSGLRATIFGDPNYDLSKFDQDADLASVMTSPFGRAYNADNPAISAFTGHGGKLLMWHGWYDPGPSPLATIRYYSQVKGTVADAGSSVRLFVAPGVSHCGGGPGPDKIDILAALDAWVSTGQAPDSVIAAKPKAGISRPLCAYPMKAVYKGSGDPNDAGSFACH